MNYIKGKYRQTIFEGSSGYKVGIFRVHETDCAEIETGKTITFTGNLPDLNQEDTYVFKGTVSRHERYGFQFKVFDYERVEPEEKTGIIEFLSSSFVKGCGIKTAEAIYSVYGNDSLVKIKEKEENLLLVSGITAKRSKQIYDSVIKYYKQDEDILFLKDLGFSIKEIMSLISLFNGFIKGMVETNIYDLSDYIEFKKLDQIFLINNPLDDERRIKACIIETMKRLTFSCGDTYLDKIEIVIYLGDNFNISANINDYLKELYLSKKIVIENEDYYLVEDYLDETYISSCLVKLTNKPPKNIHKFETMIKETENSLDIKYNEEQIRAIKNSLSNSVSIITGGPGTGKTTIINGIIKIYSKLKQKDFAKLEDDILLLAPTGRAAKKMSDTTNLPASTIHRFLKWDKEFNTFKINENNKLSYQLIIVDETSMLDNHLLASLFKGITLNTKIIFVGDEYQLPSVGPGLVLSDMINSDVIPHIRLNNIYRQSENSFIPILAKDIKDVNISEDILTKKDDYNFLEVPSRDIRNVIKQILEKSREKQICETEIQVLAPMYKGENGIDNLNLLLQEFFNPPKKNKPELKAGFNTFRVGDKVLNLVNDSDLNISNGDIGYIIEINAGRKNEVLIIDYEGNKVPYKREMLTTITHAYAITIHKSQGSEFEHVIMPITMSYSIMLYNKLLYTGVSRAKKSLVLIGSKEAFSKAINNNYSVIRKTSLKQKILSNLS